jgi:hypothetical protein
MTHLWTTCEKIASADAMRSVYSPGFRDGGKSEQAAIQRTMFHQERSLELSA